MARGRRGRKRNSQAFSLQPPASASGLGGHSGHRHGGWGLNKAGRACDHQGPVSEKEGPWVDTCQCLSQSN